MKKIFLLSLTTTALLWADGGHIAKVQNQLYIKECGSCHLAFSPSFLNREAWTKLMSNLGNHFGTDASLDKNDSDQILKFLTSNSSKHLNNPTNEIAITKLRWFQKEHRKMTEKIISNAQIKTLSNCAACHTKAQNNDFDEDSIRIPGVGFWRD